MISVGNVKLNSIDYILLVNREFTVVYSSRFDVRAGATGSDPEWDQYVNRSFFEVYPTVEKTSSSVLRCMTTGEIVVKKKQSFRDFKGKFFCTDNITLPVIRKGKIVGVVELIKDVTAIDDVDGTHEQNDSSGFDQLVETLQRNGGTITFDTILTQNEAMKKCIEQARILALSANPTLIYGETGTGKELFAQAMIQYSDVPKKKIVVQNCAAVPEGLLESILFGTARGAYTGAENRRGLFEEADGGIFFLDELNSLPIHLQGKLLRVLQDGSFRPVGSNGEKHVDVKIIAAMNVDPLAAIEKGILRKDLFYRLSAGLIYLPPLRERRDDIELYVDYYIRQFSAMHGKRVTGITPGLQEVFLNYDWDGNVRELCHIIESMISALEDGDSEVLDVKQLPAYLYERIYKRPEDVQGQGLPGVQKGTASVSGRIGGEEGAERDDWVSQCPEDNRELLELLNLKKTLETAERELLEKALRYTGGNKTKAGVLLGIPRQTLKYKMDKWNISLEEVLKKETSGTT